MTNHQRLLWLRVLALRNVVTAHEPHHDVIDHLFRRGIRKTGNNQHTINHLAWRYRRQISAELVPWERGLT